jgi:hypothetical protein
LRKGGEEENGGGEGKMRWVGGFLDVEEESGREGT